MSDAYRTCVVDGCGEKHDSRDYCRLHYKRWLKGQDLTAPPRASLFRDSCDVEGCDYPHKSNGFCQMHYGRWRRTGSPLGKGPLPLVEVVRLRRMIGLPDTGPTPAMRREWASTEGVAA